MADIMQISSKQGSVDWQTLRIRAKSTKICEVDIAVARGSGSFLSVGGRLGWNHHLTLVFIVHQSSVSVYAAQTQHSTFYIFTSLKSFPLVSILVRDEETQWYPDD